MGDEIKLRLGSDKGPRQAFRDIARKAATPYDVSDARIQTSFPAAESPCNDDRGEFLEAAGTEA